jgi:hypothetical protein
MCKIFSFIEKRGRSTDRTIIKKQAPSKSAVLPINIGNLAFAPAPINPLPENPIYPIQGSFENFDVPPLGF